VLNSIVSGIVIDNEQIGPNRYIARLGVLFDRARTGQMLGVSGDIQRSAPMLVIPVNVLIFCGFDVTHGNARVKSGERSTERRGSVALHNDPVGTFARDHVF